MADLGGGRHPVRAVRSPQLTRRVFWADPLSSLLGPGRREEHGLPAARAMRRHVLQHLADLRLETHVQLRGYERGSVDISMGG